LLRSVKKEDYKSIEGVEEEKKEEEVSNRKREGDCGPSDKE
jgi:hypothetical protein